MNLSDLTQFYSLWNHQKIKVMLEHKFVSTLETWLIHFNLCKASVKCNIIAFLEMNAFPRVNTFCATMFLVLQVWLQDNIIQIIKNYLQEYYLLWSVTYTIASWWRSEMGAISNDVLKIEKKILGIKFNKFFFTSLTFWKFRLTTKIKITTKLSFCALIKRGHSLCPSKGHACRWTLCS